MTEHPPHDTGTSQRLVLGEFVLDIGRGELLNARGELAGLRRQALDVLLQLGRRAGEVVSKDELMQRVWPNVVVGEGSLTQAISDIRRVLGDQEHRLVRNVARRGYQLVPDGAAAVPAAPAPAEQAPARTPSIRRSPPLAVLAAAAGLLALSLAAGWAWTTRAPQWVTPSALARTPLPREVPPLSIVVLPLTVEGGTAETEWLADALHGDLVIEVARMDDSHVIARDTAASFKGRAIDPRQVARELGVRHVVSGSLRQQGSAIAWKLTTNAGVLTMRIVQQSPGTYDFWGRMPFWCGGTLLLVTGYPFTYDGSFSGTSDLVVPAANVVNGQNAGGAFLDVTPNQIFTSAVPPTIGQVPDLSSRLDATMPWVAGRFSGRTSSGPVTPLASIGQQQSVTITRTSQPGQYTLSWTTAHPLGGNYVMMVALPGASALWFTTSATTATIASATPLRVSSWIPSFQAMCISWCIKGCR